MKVEYFHAHVHLSLEREYRATDVVSNEIGSELGVKWEHAWQLTSLQRVIKIWSQGRAEKRPRFCSSGGQC